MNTKWSTIQRISYSKDAINYNFPIHAKTVTNGFGISELSKKAWREVAKEMESKESGYMRNSMLFDGRGWLPTKNMHTDQVRTEYRIRYNTDKLPQNAALYPRQTGQAQFNWKEYKDNSKVNSYKWGDSVASDDV